MGVRIILREQPSVFSNLPKGLLETLVETLNSVPIEHLQYTERGGIALQCVYALLSLRDPAAISKLEDYRQKLTAERDSVSLAHVGSESNIDWFSWRLNKSIEKLRTYKN